MAGWGGGGGWGGMGGMGWNPGAAAGVGGNLMGGMGNIGKALGVAGRMRLPGMAEGGNPGGTALAAALGPAEGPAERARMEQALESLRARDRMQQAGSRLNPIHAQMPPELAHMGEPAPMGEWPYSRTGFTPFDPAGLRGMLGEDSPEFHRSMDEYFLNLLPFGAIGSMMAGRPVERSDAIRETGHSTREASEQEEKKKEEREHKKKHEKEEHHAKGGRIYVREHWRGGRAKKALALAKRRKKR